MLLCRGVAAHPKPFPGVGLVVANKFNTRVTASSPTWSPRVSRRNTKPTQTMHTRGLGTRYPREIKDPLGSYVQISGLHREIRNHRRCSN
jgi:hypothetical protein